MVEARDAKALEGREEPCLVDSRPVPVPMSIGCSVAQDLLEVLLCGRR